MSIPVICDRCRSTGVAGEADFSHLGDLLEFEPVPRRPRVDGWSPEKQRAFIAALSATGSKRRAAIAIGMHAYGVDQLLKAEGNESFKAVYDRAMAIAQANGSMKIAQGVADAAARNAQLTPPSRLRGLPSPPNGGGWGEGQGEPEMSEDRKWELMEGIGARFMRKVAAEREARLNGEIVAADFYLRQITMMEVMLDLAASELGLDAREVLSELRRGEHGILDIVTTPLAEWMDASRRLWWAQEGEPERPPHPDVRFLKRHHSEKGGYATAEGMHAAAWADPPPGVDQEEWAKMDKREQECLIIKIQEEHAAEQAAWERRAHEAWAARQSVHPPLDGEGREG